MCFKVNILNFAVNEEINLTIRELSQTPLEARLSLKQKKKRLRVYSNFFFETKNSELHLSGLTYSETGLNLLLETEPIAKTVF